MTSPSSTSLKRDGIAAGGNWIIDHVKQVDHLPERNMLANILDESFSTGGAPANVLIDLARLQPDFPLSGYGVVGDDAKGQTVLDACARNRIDATGIHTVPDYPTSYTDVMTERDSKARTFFHQRGANALFAPEHVPVKELSCRIFHLGYLLLLDAMDAAHHEHGTMAASLLRELRRHGIRTAIDVVSEESDRFGRLVPPALPHVDYLIINEIEAGRIAGLTVRGKDGAIDRRALAESLKILADMGEMELIVVHMAEGAAYRQQDGTTGAVGSIDVPRSFIKGAVGAGDAFCAGILFGLHEQWPIDKILQLANCTAIASLSHPTATGGMKPLAETLKFSQQYPEQTPPL